MYDYIVKIKMKVIFLLWKASTMYKQSYEKREMRVREGLARMKFFNFYIQIDNFTFLLGYLQRDTHEEYKKEKRRSEKEEKRHIISSNDIK